jgi:chromosomal replication initiation ATPase DnaA
VAELRERVSRQQVERFAVTEVTDAIWRACDLAMAEGRIVAIVGPTGSGKTATLRQWQQANNHGRAVYLDVPVPCGLRRLADALALSLGFTPKMSKKGHELYDLLTTSVSSRNVIILDEIGRMLPNGRGHDVSALEFVRRLHDANGCGLVLSLTYTSHQEIANGAMSGYLEQLLGRFADVVQIPEWPMSEEVEAIVRQYVPEPTPELLAEVGQFAASGRGRLRSMCEVLRRVEAAAKRSSQPVSVPLWRAAVAHLTGVGRFKGTPIKVKR